MKRYLPDMYYKNIFTINYNNLKEKGIKCLLFDLDNTLVSPDTIEVSKELEDLIKKLKKDFLILIVSNSPRKRVEKISSKLKIDFYPFALKPMQKTLKKIKEKYNLKEKELAIIGDQFLTDMKYGFKGGILRIFVDPINDRDLKITSINRLLEKKIMKKYATNNLFWKGKYYDGR